MRLMGDDLGGFNEAIVHFQAWSNGKPSESCMPEDIPAVLNDPQGFLWLELQQPSPEAIARLQALFGLHELAIEDVTLAAQRPKLEIYNQDTGALETETLFVVLNPVVSRSGVLELGELHVFLEERFIVLLHLGQCSPQFSAIERFMHAPLRLGRGRANALHAVLDEVVDDYLPWQRVFEERLDALENQVISDRANEHGVLTDLYTLKREVLRLRMELQPLEEVARSLSSGVHPQLVSKPMRPYFRDVHDHVMQLLAGLDFLREAQMGVLNLHIALGANRQSIVVRKLAGWGAILAVPTMVFSMYGMNFVNMPELHWVWGYPLILVLTLLGSVGLHRWLKRSGWL
jgi:magnesium transporter